MTITPLWKPSPIKRMEAKHVKRRDRAKAKANKLREARMLWAELRGTVFARDAYRCRACGCEVRFASDNPLEVGHAHHIKYRSAGGEDIPSNLATLCAACHWREHQHKLSVSGDPNDTLHFTERNPETGRISRQWESEVPK